MQYGSYNLKTFSVFPKLKYSFSNFPSPPSSSTSILHSQISQNSPTCCHHLTSSTLPTLIKSLMTSILVKYSDHLKLSSYLTSQPHSTLLLLSSSGFCDVCSLGFPFLFLSLIQIPLEAHDPLAGVSLFLTLFPPHSVLFLSDFIHAHIFSHHLYISNYKFLS